MCFRIFESRRQSGDISETDRDTSAAGIQDKSVAGHWRYDYVFSHLPVEPEAFSSTHWQSLQMVLQSEQLQGQMETLHQHKRTLVW